MVNDHNSSTEDVDDLRVSAGLGRGSAGDRDIKELVRHTGSSTVSANAPAKGRTEGGLSDTTGDLITAGDNRAPEADDSLDISTTRDGDDPGAR